MREETLQTSQCGEDRSNSPSSNVSINDKAISSTFQQQSLIEHPEIVDGTYTYGEHKDDSGYSYDAAAGKGSLDSEYTYKG